MAEHIGLEGNDDDIMHPNNVVADGNRKSSSESESSKRKDPPNEAEPALKKARFEAKMKGK